MSKRAPFPHNADDDHLASEADESQDPLWDLLGRTPPVTPSPFFARNVLRAIRTQEATATQAATPAADSLWTIFLRLRTLFLGGAVAVVALLLTITLRQEGSSDLFLTQNEGDIEVIANLDELLAYEESNVWLDQTVF